MPFTILLASDGSSQARVARDLVAGLPLPTGSTVRVITARGIPPPLAGITDAMREGLLAGDLAACQAELAEFALPLARPDLRVEMAVLEGGPASAILADAAATKADLVVVGSHGRSAFGSLLLGSVSAEVVDRAPCPVLVARGRTLDRVILAEDGSTNARCAGDVLTKWEIFQYAAVRVVSVVQVEPYAHAGVAPSEQVAVRSALLAAAAQTRKAHERLAKRSADRLSRAGRLADADVRIGVPAGELVAAAREWPADLVVIGSRGRTRLARLLLGSVARGVLLHAPCSVLVVPRTAVRSARAAPGRHPGRSLVPA